MCGFISSCVWCAFVLSVYFFMLCECVCVLYVCGARLFFVCKFVVCVFFVCVVVLCVFVYVCCFLLLFVWCVCHMSLMNLGFYMGVVNLFCGMRVVLCVVCF